MTKFLVTYFDQIANDSDSFRVEAESKEDAERYVYENYRLPRYRILKISHTHGGARAGSGGVSKWGDGVRTKVVRLPQPIAEGIRDILGDLEQVDGLLESWQARVDESRGRSATGEPAERYKYVAQLLDDLRAAMVATQKILE